MAINKCVVFDLPSGAGGMAAGIYGAAVQKNLQELYKQHGLFYKTKTKDRKLKVWFERESDYTLFFLIYDFPKQWRRPYIIEEEY